MTQVEIGRQLPHVQSTVWNGGDMELLKQQFDASQHRQLENSMKLESRNVSFQPQQHDSSEKTYETPIIEALGIPQFQHQRIRALHGDHQPLYVAPPPPHFFPSFSNQISSTYTLPEPKSTQQPSSPRAPPLVRSHSAAELTTSRNLVQTKSNLVTRAVGPLQPPPPVLATSSNVPSTSIASGAPTVTAPVKGKRGRKPKDPVAHAAKKEAKEKKRLEKEAAMAVQQQPQPVLVSEEILPLSVQKEPSRPNSSSGLPLSRPSSSNGLGITHPLATASFQSRPTSSSSAMGDQRSSSPMYENKKRSAEAAFAAGDLSASWLGTDASSMDMDSSWTMSTPLTSPLMSPETGGLGIFMQAPPSTPIDEILASSAQLGINPALLFQEDIIAERMKNGKLARALKSPLEIMAMDEYPLSHSPMATSSSNQPSTPSEDSGNKKLGLMDLMLLHRNSETEDKPSPKKKLRPDLVFSTTKRGKAIVSLQKNAPTEVPEPTTPVRETRIVQDTETDLRSLVLKRRQEVWGDEVGTEVTRITVHRRLTARKTSVGLMSPLSPKSSAKRAEVNMIDSDSDSSDSSDSEDETEEVKVTQVTPLATPTNPLVAGQAMKKSFSAPGFFHQPSENIFLPSTPHVEEDDEYTILPSRFDPKPFDGDSGMRCKTCGMLFRKQAGLSSHERTCMVKQTPFIPYDFLRADHVDDGFVFGGGRQLFSEDMVLTPRNLAVQMGFESPLVQKGDGIKRFPSTGFVAPMDTVSSEEEEDAKEQTLPKHKELRDIVIVGQPKGQTRCICGKSEKSVPGVMVQCGKCEYWLHTRCLKVKARDLPDLWLCPVCARSN